MDSCNSLVVGINGTIGAALFSHLQSKGMPVWGTTHRGEFCSSNIFYLNLLDAPSAWNFFDIKFDVMYLCAGVCRMASCESDRETSHKTNVTGMLALAQHFSALGAHIIYLSTNQVFSGTQAFVSPTAKYEPINEYGRQKAEMESLIKAHCKYWSIVRLTKVIAPKLQLIATWIDRLLQNQSIEAFNDMMLAPVSLSQVIRVLTTLGQKKPQGCFQISGVKDVSYFELASYLAKQLGCGPSLVKSVSALDAGIDKSFLPHFTTLDCSSTMSLCTETPLHFYDVLHECFKHELMESKEEIK